MKWPTCRGPGGIPKKGFAPSPNRALMVPYSSSSKYESSASANGSASSNYIVKIIV